LVASAAFTLNLDLNHEMCLSTADPKPTVTLNLDEVKADLVASGYAFSSTKIYPRDTSTSLPKIFAPVKVTVEPKECKVAMSWVGTGIETADVGVSFKDDVVANEAKPALTLATMDKTD